MYCRPLRGFPKICYFKAAHKDSVCTYVSVEMKVTNRLFNKMVRRFEGLVFRKLMARSGEKYKINGLQYYVAIFVC